MDDETQVRTGNRQLKEIASTLRGDIAGFALDVRTLSELQFKLFVMEAQEHGRRAVLPTIVLLFAATLGEHASQLHLSQSRF